MKGSKEGAGFLRVRFARAQRSLACLFKGNGDGPRCQYCGLWSVSKECKGSKEGAGFGASGLPGVHCCPSCLVGGGGD